MRQSIGRKIFIVMSVLSILFIAATSSNLVELSTIKTYNDHLSQIYIRLVKSEGIISADFQRVQNYVNLYYYVIDTEAEDFVVEALEGALNSVNEEIGVMSEYIQSSAEEDFITNFNTYSSALKEYITYVEDIVSSGSREKLMNLGKVQPQYVQAIDSAQEAFDIVSDEKLLQVENMSTTRINKAYRIDLILLILFIGVIGVVAWFSYIAIAKPARQSEEQIQDMVKQIQENDGDLTKRIPVRSRDEIGRISNGVNAFIEQLQSIVKKLKIEAVNLETSADKVYNEINASNERANSVSMAMEEMSANMEEISASLVQIVKGSKSVLRDSCSMNDKVKEGVILVKDIKENASELHKNTLESKKHTNTIMEEIRTRLDEALEESRHVEEINELTKEIINITNQTNLLSLNASIEASHAGEAGKGFTVVANEIRVLADSSAQTANNIQIISNMVTSAVKKLSKSAEDMLQFIDSKIITDYNQFAEVVGQYVKDADTVKCMLDDFGNSTNCINQIVENISTGINNISTAVDESTKGVAEVTA
ncbi:MAG: methyl-accepting chemotaxis protein, partial [Cellulosilyticum sp.]|nr:methyl-accepting chemotaxis protein [Cellulosilyticum sp.]